MGRITGRGFLIRWGVALLLVALTFNPSVVSYVGLLTHVDGAGPTKAVLGIILAIVYVIYFRATFNSIGLIGIGIMILLFGSIGWFIVDLIPADWINSWMVWIFIALTIGTTMAVGMSWSFVRRFLSGQFDGA